MYLSLSVAVAELSSYIQQSSNDEYRVRRGIKAVHCDGLRHVPRRRSHARGRPRTYELWRSTSSLRRRHGRVEL